MESVRVRDYLLDVPNFQLWIGSSPIKLTPVQMLLAAELLNGPCPSKLLWRKIWSDSEMDETAKNNLSAHLAYLRRRVGDRLQHQPYPAGWLLA